MGLVEYLFGVLVVVVLARDVTAQHHWMSLQKSQPPVPPQRHSKQVPAPQAPFDKCQVEESEKIRCGALDIAAERCDHIDCCFDGRQCYYGKAGVCAVLSINYMV